jgi:hypothetical protein
MQNVRNFQIFAQNLAAQSPGSVNTISIGTAFTDLQDYSIHLMLRDIPRFYNHQYNILAKLKSSEPGHTTPLDP